MSSLRETLQRRESTDRFAEMIVQQVRHSDMPNVGVNPELTDEAVASMVHYIAPKNARGREPTQAVRQDEIAWRNGPGQYVVVLVD